MSRWESMMVFYGSSHRHPVNVVLHLLFVPVILGTSLGLLGALPGPLPLGWIGAAGLLAVWFLVDRVTGLTLLLPTVVLGALGHHLVARPSGVGLAAGLWVVGWIAQFVGHGIEGRRPSLLNNAPLALVSAPMFVAMEVARGLGFQKGLFARVQQGIAALNAEQAARP